MLETFPLSTVELAVVGLVTFFAGLVRGFTGFGSGLMIVPVLSVVVGPLAAVPTVIITHTYTTLQLLPDVRRNWDRTVVVPLCIGGVIGVPLGVYGLVAIDGDLMRRLISGIIIVLTVIMMAGWRYRGRPRTGTSGFVGGLGGVLSGAAAIGGPPVIIYLLAGPDRAAANRAAFILYFFVIQIVSMVGMWIAGILDWRVAWLCAILTPPLMIGMWLGTNMFHRAGEETFRKVAMGFLLLIGIVTLFL